MVSGFGGTIKLDDAGFVISCCLALLGQAVWQCQVWVGGTIKFYDWLIWYVEKGKDYFNIGIQNQG